MKNYWDLLKIIPKKLCLPAAVFNSDTPIFFTDKTHE